MAQRNRRRARGSGTTPGAADRARNGNGNLHRDSAEPSLDSGDEMIAEAQLALGRPAPEERPSPEELTAFEEADAGRGDAGALSTSGLSGSGAVVAAAQPSVGLPARTVSFLQGSWRELQRVQWPDRRQVFQATGVVLGFVIVAGAFLGVASFAAQKIVNLILYGHG